MYLRFGFVLVVAALCFDGTRADFEEYLEDESPSYRVVRDTHLPPDENLQRHRPVLLPGQHPRPLVQIPENYPQGVVRHQRELTEEEFAPRQPRSISQTSFPRPGPRPQPSPTFPKPPRPSRFRRDAEEPSDRHTRSLQPSGPRYPPQPSPTFPDPPRPRFRRDAEEPSDRYTRSLQPSIPRYPPPPSPTFPDPPRPRFRRDAEEPADRYTRSVQPSSRLSTHTRPHYPSPIPQPSPTFPRPGDSHGPVLARFRRGGGRVSVDVEKNRGQKSTTRVTAEQNVYRSGDGRTRVDASGYATNRGDRGGMINFSHRF